MVEVNPYNRRYSQAAKLMHKEGLLRSYPRQEVALLQYDDGIDIVYDFKDIPPARFKEVSELLLLAAEEEINRYEFPGRNPEDFRFAYAKIEVKLNRTVKGKKMAKPTRWYIASLHSDPDVMIYGEKALGYTTPDEVKPYLIDKIEEIISIPESSSPGAYVKKIRPYTVSRMVIGLRRGLRKLYEPRNKAEKERREKELEERERQKRGR